jgi:GDSL-like Lipase/Acylhydrolase family
VPKAALPAYNPWPNPYTFLPQNWNAGWLAAKVASGSAPAWITFLTDSIGSGLHPCSDCVLKSYIGVIRTTLNLTYGYYADYYPAWGLSPDDDASMVNCPWTAMNTGAGATLSVDSGKGWHKLSTNGAAATSTYMHQTFTTPLACTAMDLFYVDANAGTWNYSVDGGANVPVVNAGGAAGARSVKKVSITGLANAIHTIAVGFAPQAVCMPLGVACYYGTTGIGTARWTNGSVRADDYVNSVLAQTGPVNRFALIGGENPQKDGQSTFGTFGFPTAPHLFVYSLGINDSAGGGLASNTLLGAASSIEGLRRGRPNASVLLLLPCNPGPSADGVGFAGNWPTWRQAYLDLALTYGCAFIDIGQRWGQTPYGQGFLTTNSVHPSDLGHADIAAAVLSVI